MKIFAMMAALFLALSLYLAWTPDLSREALLQSYSRAGTYLVKVSDTEKTNLLRITGVLRDGLEERGCSSREGRESPRRIHSPKEADAEVLLPFLR